MISYTNNILKTVFFNGGERHVKTNCKNMNESAWCFNPDANDLVELLMAVNVAKKNNIELEVFIPYAPAARADHDITKGLEIYGNLLEQIAQEVPTYVVDPHSSVFSEVCPSVKIIKASKIINSLPKKVLQKIDAIIAPDKGAFDRANETAKNLGLPLFTCSKERNQKTGKIVSYSVDKEIPNGFNCLVVDDICDGGFTFKLLAESLPEQELSLYVSHGIFSGNARENLEQYKEIFTTNSMTPQSQVNSLSIINLNKNLFS